MDGENKMVTCKLLKVCSYKPIANSRGRDGQPIVQYAEMNDSKAPQNFILIPETMGVTNKGKSPGTICILPSKSKICVAKNGTTTEEKSIKSNTKVSVQANLFSEAKNGWTTGQTNLIQFENNGNICDSSTELGKTVYSVMNGAITEEKSVKSSTNLSTLPGFILKQNNRHLNSQLNDNMCLIPIDNIDNLDNKPRKLHEARATTVPKMLKGKKLYVCKICSKVFAHKCYLKTHVRTHTGERPCVCDVCGKAFSSRSGLWSHKKTHSAEKRFLCELCGKMFLMKGAFETHLKSHSGEKCYVCSICNKSYISSCALSIHKRLHFAKESLLTCKICSRNFKVRDQYRLHIRLHEEDKQFSCNVCDKKFIMRSLLKRHLRTHTGERPYTCDNCEKTFSSRANLRLHYRQHTDEHPYLCHLCPKTFKSRSNMQTHIRTHFGIKPYTCNVCNRKFTQTHSLKKHIADKVCLKVINKSEKQSEECAITCEN